MKRIPTPGPAIRPRDADNAYARAELWEANYFEAVDTLDAYTHGVTPGITQAGQVVMLPSPSTH